MPLNMSSVVSSSSAGRREEQGRRVPRRLQGRGRSRPEKSTEERKVLTAAEQSTRAEQVRLARQLAGCGVRAVERTPSRLSRGRAGGPAAAAPAVLMPQLEAAPVEREQPASRESQLAPAAVLQGPKIRRHRSGLVQRPAATIHRIEQATMTCGLAHPRCRSRRPPAP